MMKKQTKRLNDAETRKVKSFGCANHHSHLALPESSEAQSRKSERKYNLFKSSLMIVFASVRNRNLSSERSSEAANARMDLKNK
jgi:hypothetical protein